MKYRKKPVVIEAVQWTGENPEDIVYFTKGKVTGLVYSKLEIRTLEGVMTADIGDWIIKGVKGEFYPCKPDIFKQTYDEVTEVPNDKQVA